MCGGVRGGHPGQPCPGACVRHGSGSGARGVGRRPTGLRVLGPRCHLGAADGLASLLPHKERRAQPCAASTHGRGECQRCPGALCAGQAAMSLAAGQAAEGERESKPRQGPAVPGAVPTGEARDRQPLCTPPHGERGRCARRRPRRGASTGRGMLLPWCSACRRARLAPAAQRRWLAAYGGSCRMPWQGAKKGN